MHYDIGLIGPLNVDLLITGQAPTDMAELTRWAGPSNVFLCAAGSAGYIAQDLARFGLKPAWSRPWPRIPSVMPLWRILREAGLNITTWKRRQIHFLVSEFTCCFLAARSGR